MKKVLSVLALGLMVGVSGSALAQATTTLTGTVRDFSPTHSDFESGISGVAPGMVSSTLTGSAPTYIGSGGYGAVASAASFDQWWGPAAPSMSYGLTLTETAAGSGVYTYTNNNFFPIDNQLLGNYAYGHNYHFTYQIGATFGYVQGAGQTFTFGGDDDVWVYFDKKLGIDLGGVHGFASQTVNLDTLFGPGKASGNYAFDFFFAERHTTGSNLTISTSLNLQSAPVPEPETFVMVLTSLGLLGFVGRRRKQQKTAA